MFEAGEWSRLLRGELYERWPKDEKGEPEEPVCLGTLLNHNMLDELTVNMLEACGIPCLRVYPGDGSFGKILFGTSGQGTEIFVPKSLAADAAALFTYQGDYEMED